MGEGGSVKDNSTKFLHLVFRAAASMHCRTLLSCAPLAQHNIPLQSGVFFVVVGNKVTFGGK